MLSYERRQRHYRGIGGGAQAGAVEFISSSSVNYAQRTNTTIPAPADIQDGDHLLILWEGGANPTPPTPTPPADFTLLDMPPFPAFRVDSNGFRVDIYAWQKFANGESGDYEVTHANGFSDAYMQVARGANLATPISPTPTLMKGLGDTATAPGLTTVIDNSLIVYWCGKWNFPGITPPGGVTPILTTRLDGSVTLLFVSTGNMTPPGATGDKIATGLPNTPTEPWASGLIAIRP